MEVYDLGKAPWELEQSKSTGVQDTPSAIKEPITYDVGKAPWEVSEPTNVTQESTRGVGQQMTFVDTVDHTQVPESIVDYTPPNEVGKNSSWLDDIISTGKDIAKELYNPVRPGVESAALTLGAVGSGIGEIIETPLSAVSRAVGGKPVTYYSDLKQRLDEQRENNDKEVIKSLGGGIANPSTISEIALGFGYGNTLKSIVAMEGLVQGALAKPGDKLESAAVGAGVTLVGGKVIESAINRYVGTDRTLRKLYKTIGMDEQTAKNHFESYSKVVGKDVNTFTVTDKVNAIVHGSPEAESILFESVASSPANAKMLNNYYSKVTQSLINNLDTMNYEQSIAVGNELKKGIREGYNNITRTLDESSIGVKIDEPIKTAVQTFTKNALDKLDSADASIFSQRVEKLLSDTGSVGDLFEVEKVIRSNINKIDKLGTDASLNEAKGLLKSNMQGLLVKTLEDNGLNNIVESRKLLNDLYTKVSNANNKKLVKVLQNVDIKKDDYKKIYEAMKSTEEGSSYNNLINVLGPNSKAAGNVEEFVLDRLMNKNMGDLDVLNLGKLIGNLEDVTFKSTDGKLMNQIISDFNKAFTNIKSTDAWMFERIDAGGSKSDLINQLKASVIGRMAYKIVQYLPINSSRRVYVINKLPEYLKEGLVPKVLKADEKRSVEVYKTVFNNVNRLLAEELNNMAEKSKAQAEYLRSVQPETALLGNNTTMTATQRGSVVSGTGEAAAKSARANDILGRPNTGQAINSTTNEVQAPTRELVDTTIEPDISTTSKEINTTPKDIIDTDIVPSHTIDTNGVIWDTRGNKWGSLDDLVKAESLPDNLKLPEKVITPVKDFFDYKRILKEDPKAKELSKQVQSAKGEAKNAGKLRLARLLEYNRLREEGLSPAEAHKASLKVDGSNIDNNGKVKLLLVGLGVAGYSSNSDASMLDTRVIAKDYTDVKEYIKDIESKGKTGGAEYTTYNKETGAYGKYQLLESTYKYVAGKLKMSEKAIKTPRGQEKAMDFIIKDNTRKLKLFNLPVTNANLFVLHNLGGESGARVLRGTYTKGDIIKMANNLPDAAEQLERVDLYSNEIINNYSVYYGVDIPIKE